MDQVKNPSPKDRFKERWPSHQGETKAPLYDAALMRMTTHSKQFNVGARKVNEIYVLEVSNTTQT